MDATISDAGETFEWRRVMEAKEQAGQPPRNNCKTSLSALRRGIV